MKDLTQPDRNSGRWVCQVRQKVQTAFKEYLWSSSSLVTCLTSRWSTPSEVASVWRLSDKDCPRYQIWAIEIADRTLQTVFDVVSKDVHQTFILRVKAVSERFQIFEEKPSVFGDVLQRPILDGFLWTSHFGNYFRYRTLEVYFKGSLLTFSRAWSFVDGEGNVLSLRYLWVGKSKLGSASEYFNQWKTIGRKTMSGVIRQDLQSASCFDAIFTRAFPNELYAQFGSVYLPLFFHTWRPQGSLTPPIVM